MTIKTVEITSYDVAQEIKDKLNAISTIEEVKNYLNTVKAPCDCFSGDPDLTIWNACVSILEAENTIKNEEDSGKLPVPTREELLQALYVDSGLYDEES